MKPEKPLLMMLKLVEDFYLLKLVLRGMLKIMTAIYSTNATTKKAVKI